MKKIVYISPDCFFDVDFPILKGLVKQYNIIWYPIISENSPRYSAEYIQNFSKENGIQIKLWLRKGRRRNLRQFGFSYKLLKNARNEKADIVYCEYFGDPYFSIFMIWLLKKRNTVIGIHDFIPHKSFSSTFEKLSTKISIIYFRYFHLFSKSQKRKFEDSFPEKICFYSPLALKDFGTSKIKRPIKDKCNFLFFGAITYYKGLDVLIRAIEQIASINNFDFKLTIAGGGNKEYWNFCKTLIKSNSFYELKIEYIPDECIPDLFMGHHFLILPYRDVTQSGPLMIALNYSLPVIAPDFEGFAEFINDGHTGFLFEKDNLNSLVESITKCLYMKAEDYEKLNNNIEEYCKKELSDQIIVQRYIDFFDTIV